VFYSYLSSFTFHCTVCAWHAALKAILNLTWLGSGSFSAPTVIAIFRWRPPPPGVSNTGVVWKNRYFRPMSRFLAQANSASYPWRDGKWVVATATGWRPSVAMVCLLAAPWVQLFVSASNGWPHNALRHHWLMPISCHFRDCKALLVTSLTHVSGAIASVQTFTFLFITKMIQDTAYMIYRFVPLTLITWPESRSRHYSTLNILETIQDTAMVTIERQ